METSFLQQEICYLKGVGPARAKLLAKLGIATVGDLIGTFPREYIDLSHPVAVAAAPVDEKCCVKATVTKEATERFLPGGRKMYTVQASDGTVRLQLVFFNTRFAAMSLKQGQTYGFYGKIGGGFTVREMVSPMILPTGETEGLRPVYPLTAGITAKVMTGLVRTALEKCTAPFEDFLPEPLKKAYGLCGRDEAIRAIHFPASYEQMQTARKRLIFDELLILQLGLRRLKTAGRGVSPVVLTKEFTPEFWDSLPFAPTGAQRRVTDSAIEDMLSGVPMNRLVQGDVGSGKTAVAAALCHTVAKNGWQCAVMAPTELLARQHYETFSAFLAPLGITVGLLTGSQKAAEKRAVLSALAAGEIQVAVGTHALLEPGVQFRALGLVVTDEQHRFGVAQRAALAAKGSHPHLLVMSATPIPRTLALIVYGDLDLSVIDELPPGRQPVATYAVTGGYHPRLYAYMEQFMQRGRQIYVVCPLVEDGEETHGLLSAEHQREILQKQFPEREIGLLHGRMSAKEKEAVMTRFAAGDLPVLVATTVVEVGVDVPNATLMIIENAERFGLSQLHQLRGRVGRGQEASVCVLVSDHTGEQNQRRLNIMKQTTDGFVIADEDLKMRGPGDFFGNRQHGLPAMRLADLMTDGEALRATARAAGDLLAEDPLLQKPQNAPLARRVDALCAEVSAS